MATAEATARDVGPKLVEADSYVEVYDEPLHPTMFENEYVRVLKVDCVAETETLFHRHSQDSFFLFFRTAQIRNETVGKVPFEVRLDAGSFYWGDHLRNPIVHKICVGKSSLDCMDVEIKADRPKTPHPSPMLVNTASREMCFENDVLRVYRIKIAPGNKLNAPDEDGSAVSFPCLVVTMCDAKLSRGNVKAGVVWWLDEGLAGSLDSNDGDGEAAVAILQPK